MRGYVFHVDMDQFIAAVEILRRPELAGLPVVVGGDGDPTKRAVVSTASYEARAFGIRSGMPLRTAAKRNPDAVFLPVDADAYNAASREVMDTLRSFEAVVEVAGWDEAFMAARTDDPEALARDIQARVRDRTRLWCTVGIGDNKLQAKIASGYGKPRGVFVLTGERWHDIMDAMPTEELWGVGAKTAAKLQQLGIRTVGELGRAPDEVLARRFGPNTGPWIGSLGRGEGSDRVRSDPYVPKGISRERTYQRDLTGEAEIRRRLLELAHELAGDVEREGRPAVRIVVKVRRVPFVTSTHGVPLGEPSMDPSAIAEGAMRALERFTLDRPVRLLGVRAELADAGSAQPEGGAFF